MKMHFSRFGLLARCGCRLDSRWLTRDWTAVTCGSCLRAKRGG